jgi:hypothetical protein
MILFMGGKDWFGTKKFMPAIGLGIIKAELVGIKFV